MMGLADQRNHGNAHVEGIHGSGTAAVGEGVKGNIHVSIGI